MMGMGDIGEGGRGRHPRRGYVVTPEERIDRAISNEAVRTQMSPLRLAGSADQYGVPLAEE
jgi:hypothetical protein